MPDNGKRCQHLRITAFQWEGLIADVKVLHYVCVCSCAHPRLLMSAELRLCVNKSMLTFLLRLTNSLFTLISPGPIISKKNCGFKLMNSLTMCFLLFFWDLMNLRAFTAIAVPFNSCNWICKTHCEIILFSFSLSRTHEKKYRTATQTIRAHINVVSFLIHFISHLPFKTQNVFTRHPSS